MSTLSDYDWEKVFQLKCDSKRGRSLSESEMELVRHAHKEDRARFAALERRVFEETNPAKDSHQ